MTCLLFGTRPNRSQPWERQDQRKTTYAHSSI